MVRDRYLLRADVEGYRYRDILEIRPGSVRLLRPEADAQRTVKIITALVVLAYFFLVNLIFLPLVNGLAVPGMPGALFTGAVIAYLAAMFAGMLLIALWWEDRALPLLAEHPARTLDVRVLGSTSYGTFQELRAATPEGEVRITVQGSKRRVEDALDLAAEGRPRLA